MVNNVIAGFQYTLSPFPSANDLKNWLKDYFPKVRTALKDSGKDKEYIQAFMAQAPIIAKFLIKNFNDVDCYLGPSFNSDSMCFSMYPEGSTTPNFYYIMAGLNAEKF